MKLQHITALLTLFLVLLIGCSTDPISNPDQPVSEERNLASRSTANDGCAQTIHASTKFHGELAFQVCDTGEFASGVVITVHNLIDNTSDSGASSGGTQPDDPDRGSILGGYNWAADCCTEPGGTAIEPIGFSDTFIQTGITYMVYTGNGNDTADSDNRFLARWNDDQTNPDVWAYYDVDELVSAFTDIHCNTANTGCTDETTDIARLNQIVTITGAYLSGELDDGDVYVLEWDVFENHLNGSRPSGNLANVTMTGYISGTSGAGFDVLTVYDWD